MAKKRVVTKARPRRRMPRVGFWPKEFILHVYHHGSPSSAEILARLERIEAQGASIMSAADDLKAKIALIDTATTNIAQDIVDIKAKIGTGMTDAEVADVNATLDAAVARLQALDAENPTGTV